MVTRPSRHRKLSPGGRCRSVDIPLAIVQGAGTMRLNLTLLGDFQAELGSGAPVRLRTRKTQALLAYLALPPGQPHSRDKLATLLWGDRSESQARSRFRETLFALRRALAATDPPCLTLTGETIALDADSVDVDARAFERLARAGDAESLARAAGLYRGDFLEGLAFRGTLFEDWLMAERERLRELALETLAKLLAQQRAAGATEEALQTALRLIALDPLQEPVHRSLMRLYAELGRRASALQQYQLCVGILERELGVEPEEETRRLYQEILSRRLAPLAGATSRRAPDTRDAVRRPRRRGHRRPARRARPGDGAVASGASPRRPRAGEADRPRRRGGHGQDPARGRTGGGGPPGRTSACCWGAATRASRSCPFAPWLDIVKAARELADGTWLADLPLGHAARAGAPAARARATGRRCGAPPDYLMLFEGVSALLEHVADRQPTVADPRGPPLVRRDERQAAGLRRPPPPGVAASSGGHGARGGTGGRADASADPRRAGSRAPRRHDHAPTAVAEGDGRPRPRSRAGGP